MYVWYVQLNSTYLLTYLLTNAEHSTPALWCRTWCGQQTSEQLRLHLGLVDSGEWCSVVLDQLPKSMDARSQVQPGARATLDSAG